MTIPAIANPWIIAENGGPTYVRARYEKIIENIKNPRINGISSNILIHFFEIIIVTKKYIKSI